MTRDRRVLLATRNPWVRRDAPFTLARKFLTTTARIGRNGTVAGAERRQGRITTPRGT